MSLWDKLVEGVATVVTTGIKVARAVGSAVSAGLAAVGRVAQRVVKSVEAGWNYVRKGAERAGAAIAKAARWAAQPIVRAVAAAKKFVDEVREQVNENLGEAQPRRERKAHNDAAARAAREAEEQLVAERDKERIAREEREARLRTEAEAEAEAQRQYELDDRMRVEFVAFAEALDRDLNVLLERSTIDDFATYLRIRTCASLTLAFAGDAGEVESFRGSIDDRVVTCFHSIKHLSVGNDLSPPEWAALDELSHDRLGGGLIERSGEQLFAMWIGERFDVERRLDTVARDLAEAKGNIYYAENRLLSVGALTPEETVKRDTAKVRLERLTAEQTVRRERLHELVLFSGVAEGLLQVLTGEETDDFAAEEMSEAGRIMVAWAAGNPVTNDERELLASLALLYRARASQRAERIVAAASVTVTA
jgi:hypothetical protein